MSEEFKTVRQFDKLIHEPSRLAIMAVLSACESADFAYMMNATELSKGNLSAHAKKLVVGGYLQVTKTFKGNYPHTSYKLTSEGIKAFKAYRKQYLALAKKLTK